MVTIVLVVGGAILLWIGVAMVFSAGERAKASEGTSGAAGDPRDPLVGTVVAPEVQVDRLQVGMVKESAWQEKFIAGLVMIVMSLLQWVSVVLVNR